MYVVVSSNHQQCFFFINIRDYIVFKIVVFRFFLFRIASVMKIKLKKYNIKYICHMPIQMYTTINVS